jgi:hypothetical protein
MASVAPSPCAFARRDSPRAPLAPPSSARRLALAPARLPQPRQASPSSPEAPTSSSSSSSSSPSSAAIAEAKRDLFRALDGTCRGAAATSGERRAVDDAQVALESLSGQSARDLDLDALAGRWRLAYTTAGDVLSVLRLARDVGVIEVGDIFQTFTADGRLQNEIRLSLPGILAPAVRGEPGGLALKVEARYERRDEQSDAAVLSRETTDASSSRRRPSRSLRLTFEEAALSDLRVSDAVEALIAPALLPRGGLNHRILLALRELEVRFPLRGALEEMLGGGGGGGGAGEAGVADAPRPGAAVGTYRLSYLDEDVLVGRANELGGVFIFTRAS